IRDKLVTGVQTCALPICLSICAVGDRVVVRDGNSHWQVDDGQYLLGLDVSVEDGVLRVAQRQEESASGAAEAHDWFERGLELERSEERRVGKEGRGRCAA